MPTVFLIRHGENDYVKKGRMAGRLPGVHLNDKGRSQAQSVADMLARMLKDAPVKGVYSSPLERALETAEPIAKTLALPIIQRPGLLETDMGEWQNKTIKSLSRLKAWKTVQRTPSLFCFPGGETFMASQLRICSELRDLSAQHEDKDVILCVSHADPIKLAVSYFIGQPLDLFQRLSVSPASLTALYIGEMNSNLITLNYSAAFQEPKPSEVKETAQPDKNGHR